MSDGPHLVNLGEISKPADTLIKKISGALGGIFEPHQIKRVAKAEAEASLIKAQSEIEITDLQRRAFARWVGEESKKQENIEGIAQKAIPHLKEGASPEKMDDDWITNFFDKCRIVSNDEMQDLWAKILSGEANAPGMFSKRTVNLLGTLERTEAEAFVRLMGFGWNLGEPQPLIFDYTASIYNDAGVTFQVISNLESVGLLRFETFAGFRRQGYPQKAVVFYFGAPIALEFTGPTEIQTGKVLLTKAGIQLARICESNPVDGFIEYTINEWAKGGVVISSPLDGPKGPKRK